MSVQWLTWAGQAWNIHGIIGSRNVKARLDRAFGNTTLTDLFANVKVRHIVAAESDHCFVLADLREN